MIKTQINDEWIEIQKEESILLLLFLLLPPVQLSIVVLLECEFGVCVAISEEPFSEVMDKIDGVLELIIGWSNDNQVL